MLDRNPAANLMPVSVQSLIGFCGRHGDGVLIWDQNSRLQGANDLVANLLKVSRDQLAPGLSLAALRDLLMQGPLGEICDQLFPSDLSNIDWDAPVAPAPDGEDAEVNPEIRGISSSFFALGTDLIVTLIHQSGSVGSAIEELSLQNLYLETLLENMTEGVLLVDASEHVISCNKRYRDLVGVEDHHYYRGMPVLEFARHHKDLMELPDAERSRRAAERAGWGAGKVGSTDRITKSRMNSDGRVISVTRTRLHQGGVVITARDATDEDQLRRERLRLQTVIDNIEDGVSLLSKEGLHEVYNARYLELFGIEKDKVAPGMHILEMFRYSSDYRDLPPDVAEDEMRRRADAAINEQRDFVEYNRTLQNGRTINLRRVRLDHGDAVYMYRDVTREKERERLMGQARADAEDANRLKSDFIARVSHELRTPMHGVLGMAELIRQSPLNDNQSRCLDVLCRSGRHMVDLIDGLLTISTIETGEIVLEPEETDLANLLYDCVSMIRPRAEEKGLILSLDHDFSAGGVAMVDGLRLAQVVINLVTNAVKYTHSGRIDVSAHTAREGADLVLHADIMDTGCGIAPEQLEGIFEKFKQIRTSKGAMVEGVGLGLAIAQSLTDLMGGQIDATSVLGQGSTFSIELRAPAAASSTAVTGRSKIVSGGHS